MYKVSIILPTYNRSHILGKAIESVRIQTYDNFELIIVDDCSTDETEQMIYAYEDPRLKYIRNDKNLGAAGSRNRGADVATGEYIAFVDSDTEWFADKLEKQMELIISGKGIGMVYSPIYKFGELEKWMYPPAEIPMNMKSGDIFHSLLQVPLVDTPTMLIPKNVWDEAGGFREELRSLEDYELSLRIAKKYLILMYPEPLINSYYTEGCVSDNIDEALKSRFYMLREFKTDYVECNLFEKMLNTIMKMAIENEKLTLYTQLVREFLI